MLFRSARWEREDEIARNSKISKVCTITTTSNTENSNARIPPTVSGKAVDEGKPTFSTKKSRTIKPASDKWAGIFQSMGTPFTFDSNDLDFDDCNISEVIKFLQKLVKIPSDSTMNKAFTQHITNALMQVREEKLKLKASIPRKIEDGWEPIIKMKVENFDCNALCDLGASISVMPRKIYDMIDLPPLEQIGRASCRERVLRLV